MADCLLELETCSGDVCIKRLLIEVTDCLLELESCSGHVCMERLLYEVTDCLLELEHPQAMYVLRGFSIR